MATCNWDIDTFRPLRFHIRRYDELWTNAAGLYIFAIPDATSPNGWQSLPRERWREVYNRTPEAAVHVAIEEEETTRRAKLELLLDRYRPPLNEQGGQEDAL